MSTKTAEQRIHVLPENIVNQIAAGEVILRPASVLKELLENSIDAGAHQISIWTEEGGKTRIQVTDDGTGMSPIDAKLCFERHATSKISSIQDLYRLQTRGFRGEALASIAAVAQVELFTRRPIDEVGTRILIAFGEHRFQEPVRCNPGTTIIVSQLFRQLPVRRKSLRSTPTEHRHNLQEFLRVAYPHPEIAYQYFHDEVRLYHLNPQTLQERILALNPILSPGDLLPVYEQTPLFSVQGYFLSPEKIPPDNKENYLFINRRFIRHAAIQQGIWQVFKPLLRTETRPLYWLFLEIPPNEIDINLVPSKTEARLVHEMEIRYMLASIVQKALARAFIPFPAETSPDLGKLPSSEGFSGAPASPQAPDVKPLQEVPLFPASQRSSPEASAILIAGRYLILSASENGAWVIDVWRAYQRLSYEVFLKKRPLPSQGLLFPVYLPVSPEAFSAFAAWKETLASYGLQIELREGKEVVLYSLPAGLSTTLAQPLLEKLLSLSQETPDSIEAITWDETLPKMIYRILESQRVRPFTLKEAQDMAERLQQAMDPNYTPAGQPIRLFLSREILESLFG